MVTLREWLTDQVDPLMQVQLVKQISVQDKFDVELDLH